jgi:2-hydroxychromene-2-carboxylate isomerase
VSHTGGIALDPNLLSIACTAARLLNVTEAYARSLFRAVFVDDLAAVDRNTCIVRATDVGLDENIFADILDDAETREERDRTTENAAALGVFGVPTFAVDGRLFWGNDRLVLLRHALLNKKSPVN